MSNSTYGWMCKSGISCSNSPPLVNGTSRYHCGRCVYKYLHNECSYRDW
jgi:ribosomal protein S27AE